MRNLWRGTLVASSSLLGLVLVLRVALDRQVVPEPLRSAAQVLESKRDADAQPRSKHQADREEEDEDNRPGFDEPDQFARILMQMRIPADRQEPEYTAGYRVRELTRARATQKVTTALPWLSRGPGNVSGRALAIVVDPDDPNRNTWFIGTAGGGVWKTTNTGATWTELTANFPVLSCQSLAMAASNHNVMYVGTGESFYSVDVINGNGILKSIDRGATWTHLAATINNPAFNNVARIIVDPTDPNIVLAACTVGRYKEAGLPRSSIYKSVDGGLSWVEKFAVTDISAGRVKKILQIVENPANFNIQYGTVDEAGIVKSVNAGETWSYINTGITDLSGRFEIAISPLDPNRLYAAAEGTAHSELWISTNGGTSWSRTVETGTEPNWLGAQGWYDNTIVCDPTNTNIVYVGGIRLWKITLSGTNRTTAQLSTGSVHVDHHGLAVLQVGPNWRLLNTNDGGIGVSASTSTNWSNPIVGLTTTQFYGADKRPGAQAYFGGMQDNGTWFSPVGSSSLTPWTNAIGGDGYETSWHFDDPLKMIGGSQYNGLARSLDGGATWTSATSGLSDVGSANAPFITKIAKTNQSPDFLCAVGRQGVWRSTNFGASWALAPVAVGTWGAIGSFHDVKISRANPSIVWGGARMDATARIHVSTNGAATFAAVPNYTTVTMGGISGLATHPTDQNTAYVLFSFAGRPKILKTTNLGSTWSDITGFEGGSPSTNGFPDVAVYDLLVFSDDPTHLWAATEIGLVESTNGGTTWALANNGLSSVSVWDLAESEDEVVAGTHGRGIWSVKIPSLIAGKTFKPLIDNLYQGPDGQLDIALNLRSAYDSTQVQMNGVRVTTLPANVAQAPALIQIPVTTPGIRVVMAVGYRGGVQYPSVSRTINVFTFQAARVQYNNDFEAAGNDFVGNGFTVTTNAGFVGKAIHSPHNYADNTTLTYMLTVPIRVASAHADVLFDDVAIVEPGEPGTVFGDPSFYDYVVVEGTKDGITWTPIEAGYDARLYPEWETAFNNGASGTAAMLRAHDMNLLNVFAPGDIVLLRFRLFADPGANGWGWIIDNLRIQPNAPTSDPGDLPPARDVVLAQNVPNPFNPTTKIDYALPTAGKVTLGIYDVRGRLVRGLVSGVETAGEHSAQWNGRDDRGVAVASGTYLYRLETPAGMRQRRMTLVR